MRRCFQRGLGEALEHWELDYEAGVVWSRSGKADVQRLEHVGPSFKEVVDKLVEAKLAEGFVEVLKKTRSRTKGDHGASPATTKESTPRKRRTPRAPVVERPFMILGLGASKPRKAVGAYLWFSEVPTASVRDELFEAVPAPFWSEREWAAPRVLQIGTADDLDTWCRECGGWPELRNLLLGFFELANQRLALAFCVESGGFASRRLADSIVERVLPVLDAHFAEAPARSSNRSDAGVWTLYYALDGLQSLVQSSKPLPHRDRWHATFRASCGRSYRLDGYNVYSLGQALLEESLASDDALTILAGHKRVPPDVDLAALALSVLDRRLASPDWVHEMMSDALLDYAGLAQVREPHVAEHRALNPARLEAVWVVLSRFAEVGPSGESQRAARAAHCVARATGRWDRELEVLRMASESRGPEDCQSWVDQMNADVLRKAVELGDQAVVDRLLSDILASPPGDAQLVTLMLSVLLPMGRSYEATTLARHYAAHGSEAREVEETRALMLRAFADSGNRAEEDALAADSMRHLALPSKAADGSDPRPFDARLAIAMAKGNYHVGVMATALAAWLARRNRHEEAAEVATYAIEIGALPSDLREHGDLEVARGLSPLRAALSQSSPTSKRKESAFNTRIRSLARDGDNAGKVRLARRILADYPDSVVARLCTFDAS